MSFIVSPPPLLTWKAMSLLEPLGKTSVSNFIESNGRRMMGWNEIMGKNIHQGFAEKKDDKEAELDLAKNVVVHFWKGNLDLATEAAESMVWILPLTNCISVSSRHSCALAGKATVIPKRRNDQVNRLDLRRSMTLVRMGGFLFESIG